MSPILMYHQVAKIPRELDPLGLAIPPAQFEQQMEYLARNEYRCLTLCEAVAHYRISGRLPGKSFVLTFDDGYQDLLLTVCPILDKFSFTATIFLVAGQMGSLSNWWGQNGARSGLLLTPAEARVLAQRGYTLGSHSLTHPFLTSLDDQSAFEEIRNSRVLLQEQLDIKIDYFSYPYSDTNARIERIIKSVGYKSACAGNQGRQNIFHLWRVPCGRHDTNFSFALKVRGWYDRWTAFRASAPVQYARRGFHQLRRELNLPPRSRSTGLNYEARQNTGRQA